jgi:hypothetical protein
MNLQTMLIFAMLGAVILFVVTGGLSAMMDTEADATTLGGGAALGALLGAGAGWLNSEEGSSAAESVLPAAVTSLMKGGGEAEMKVGLPAF